MKRSIGRLLVMVVGALLATACASLQPDYSPGSLDPELFVPKVDKFSVIADGSLSMADKSQKMRKLDIQQALLASMNDTIPELDYQGSLRAFGRGECGSKGKTVLVDSLDDFSASSFGGAIDRLDCANGTSPLDKALDAAGGDLTSTDVPTALVVVSDGKHMGKKAVRSAQALAGSFGDRLAIYAVQVGDDQRGRKVLEDIVAQGNGGYLVAAGELGSAAAMEKFVTDVLLYPDSDGDGVPDHLDECPDTPKGVKVDAVGCPLDSDGDGVPDYLDKCPGTPRGVQVDRDGCPIDSDGDGVPDDKDKCPGTPRGVRVDADGCPIDSDGDGVPDYLDKCPGTPRGVPVDETGCPPEGITVRGNEWMVQGQVLFAVNKAELKPAARALMLRAVDFLKENPQFVVEIQGHTDSTGPMAWNMELSKKRAESVKTYLVSQGIAADRLSTKGFGPHEPIASNETREGRAQNRRVDFAPSTR